MPKAPRQKFKLLYILKLLNEKTCEDHGVTVNEIIQYLDSYDIKAERKSIYEDLNILSLFGVDICRTNTKKVEYFIGNRDFELPELKLLVDAVQSSKFITHKKSTELIRKIENLTNEYDAKKLQRQVVVTNRVKTMNERIYLNIDYVHEAINSKNKISFYYYKWELDKNAVNKVSKVRRNNGERYVVSPWALSWDDENYYLIAFDSDTSKIKHYRLDKMENIKIHTDEKCEGQEQFKKFDIAIYSKQIFGMFGGELVDVKIRFDNSLIGVVVDRFSKNVLITMNDDGTFDMSAKVMLSPMFYSWLFAFSSSAKLLAPESAKQEFLRLIDSTRENYN